MDFFLPLVWGVFDRENTVVFLSHILTSRQVFVYIPCSSVSRYEIEIDEEFK